MKELHHDLRGQVFLARLDRPYSECLTLFVIYVCGGHRNPMEND